MLSRSTILRTLNASAPTGSQKPPVSGARSPEALTTSAQFGPVTVKGSPTRVAESAPASVMLVEPGFAVPGTLMVAPEMTPSPFACTVVEARPSPKLIVTASFGANPEPLTMIAVPRGPEVADSVACGWYVRTAGCSVTWTVAVAGVREDAPAAVTEYRPGCASPDAAIDACTAPVAEAATVKLRAGLVPSLTVTCSPAANPLPLTVIGSPSATVADGDTEIDGCNPARAPRSR